MRNRLKNINFYLTSLDIWSSIDSLVDSGTFVVKDTTVNWFSLTNGNQIFFVIVDADQTLKREIFRITNVNISTRTLTFDKRISPNWKQSHSANALVQINDFAELFNYLSLHLDDVWYTEVVTWRDVKIAWWILRYGASNVSIVDSTFTMNPNTTNYIILDFADWIVKVVTSLTGMQYFLFATAVANGTDVISLTDNRATFVWFDTSLVTPSITVGNTTTLVEWSSATVSNVGTALNPIFNFWIPKGNTWNIWEPWVDGQTITDNVLPPDLSTVKTDNSTYITVTYSNSTYTKYELNGWNNYDSNNNAISIKRFITWTFWTAWITYTNWNFVDKATWIVSYTWSPAYRNQDNTFEFNNTFMGDTSFKGMVSFPYTPMTVPSVWNLLFDWSKWLKQYISIWAWNYNLNFTNLRTGCNYEFAIICSWAVTLSKWVITDSDTITNFYAIWDSLTSPQSLTADVHLFVADTFNTAIHISYLWHSRAI